ncbi:MAG: class I SAM-dependent methyltransferase [Chloroflexi bacterium]|nr:class I SAM-dependent methyltransferase [Chloroflexota bacterium]
MVVIENAAYGHHELLYNRFMEPALQSAIHLLRLPPGSRGLDAGCGPGGVLHLLDNATGSVGHITGVDISPALLDMARQQVEQWKLDGRVSLACADLSQPLPFADDVFDWVWSADVLCSDGEARGFADPVEVIREFARVVKPGGTVAIFLGNRLGAMYLPGHAHLEQCLSTAIQLNYLKTGRFAPSFYHEPVLAWLRTAGLTHLKISAHIAEYQYPLKPDVRDYIREFIFAREYAPTPELKQRAHGVGLTEDEWATWVDISDPASPNYLLDSEDYYCVRFGTLATGHVLE